LGGGGGFEGAALLTFCEQPSGSRRTDALPGFIFRAAAAAGTLTTGATPEATAGTETLTEAATGADPTSALVGGVTLVGLSVNCGLSDATVTPNGVHVLFLYHCYTPGHPRRYGNGVHRTEIRAAQVSALRTPGAEVAARLLVAWSGGNGGDSGEGCSLSNMEGIHAFMEPAPRGGGQVLALVLVSDNNMHVEEPTQIAKFHVIGGVYAEDAGGVGEGEVVAGAAAAAAAAGLGGARVPPAAAAAQGAAKKSKRKFSLSKAVNEASLGAASRAGEAHGAVTRTAAAAGGFLGWDGERRWHDATGAAAVCSAGVAVLAALLIVGRSRRSKRDAATAAESSSLRVNTAGKMTLGNYSYGVTFRA
jgi:hypothetical protein